MTLQRTVASGEYYHVFNRAAHKASIFREKNDWLRMLFLILYAQSPLQMRNVSRIVPKGSTTEGFEVSFDLQARILQQRYVDVVTFCIMPNHFHLLLKEKEEGGIAKYMQRVLVGYTMYFNTKYGASGHVFQGRYKAVHVRNNGQLLYLSSYIHRNPRELEHWKGDEYEKYPYSSLQDYIDKNRWGGLLATDIIAEQFEMTAESNYRDFVRSSTAKMLEEELDPASVLENK